MIIPALNIVGKDYETGKIFLPQLIQSAETTKKAETVKAVAATEPKKIEKEPVKTAAPKTEPVKRLQKKKQLSRKQRRPRKS